MTAKQRKGDQGTLSHQTSTVQIYALKSHVLVAMVLLSIEEIYQVEFQLYFSFWQYLI